MSGTISLTCSVMKRSYLKPSNRKETAVPAGPPIARSMTRQVRRPPRRGKASRCGPWHFSSHHAQRSSPTKKACVGVTQAFRGFSLLLEKAIKSLRQKTRFSSYSNLLLGALPFLGPLAAYRAVDPGCHTLPPFFTAHTHTTR